MNTIHAFQESLHESFYEPFHEPFHTPSCESVPDVPANEKAAMELVKRIRKLRWVGMDAEARLLQEALRHLPLTGTVLAFPQETD